MCDKAFLTLLDLPLTNLDSTHTLHGVEFVCSETPWKDTKSDPLHTVVRLEGPFGEHPASKRLPWHGFPVLALCKGEKSHDRCRFATSCMPQEGILQVTGEDDRRQRTV